ncbi:MULTISPECIES: IS66 family insertion sequence element accessory protein TnpA [unclassified Dehalobacter]|uniref:IS66 family insertion sequence element accessory protein TnpA n=1 Tax=unclassified Dehalobacter TaxID=2635733 RepID=UPI00258BBEB3|nr:transposase [Dehalobacter sp.]MCM1566835.1 transposase [Dehalobacter sp.]MDJ0306918.1 transposase [Dehalobacter sp.]
MDSREATRQYRLNQWAQRIRECRSSGQKIADWCAEHGLSETTYFYWLKRVREAACEALPALNAEKNPIVPVNIAFPVADADHKRQDSSADIVVSLGAVSLEIHNSAAPALIENTLRALQNVR